MKQSLSILAILLLLPGFIGLTIKAQIKAGPRIVMTNAYDAFGKDNQGLKKDFGFSAVIEYQGKTILFDSGTDARVFEQNLKSLKIDLRKVDITTIQEVLITCWRLIQRSRFTPLTISLHLAHRRDFRSAKPSLKSQKHCPRKCNTSAVKA
jgi:hypothetical protein